MKNVILFTCMLLSFTLLFVACKKESDCIDESLIDRNAACFDVRELVCGCDNKTYDNECEATKRGITSWKEGKCLF